MASKDLFGSLHLTQKISSMFEYQALFFKNLLEHIHRKIKLPNPTGRNDVAFVPKIKLTEANNYEKRI